MKWALISGFLDAGLAWAGRHAALAAGAGLALALVVLLLLTIYLPQPHYRAAPAVILALLTFAAGFLGRARLGG